jgi:hypothetical protein
LYDLNWKQLPYKINSHYAIFPSPKKPKCLKELVKLASILSKGFSYVRVDFYIINEKIYFGEMTFYTSGGLEDIRPSSFEKRISSLIKFPKLAYNVDIGEYYYFKEPTKTKFYLLLPYYISLLPLIYKLFHYLRKVKYLILVVKKNTLLFKKNFFVFFSKSKKYKLQDIINISISLNYKNNDNSISRINVYLNITLNKKGKEEIIFYEKVDTLLKQNELEMARLNDIMREMKLNTPIYITNVEPGQFYNPYIHTNYITKGVNRKIPLPMRKSDPNYQNLRAVIEKELILANQELDYHKIDMARNHLENAAYYLKNVID